MKNGLTENGLGHRRIVIVSKLGPGVPRPWGHEPIGYGPERQEADMDSSLHGPTIDNQPSCNG